MHLIFALYENDVILLPENVPCSIQCTVFTASSKS